MKFKLKRALGFQADGGITPTDAEIERLVRLLREAMGGGVYEDFAAGLREIVLHREMVIQKSFLASINLVGASLPMRPNGAIRGRNAGGSRRRRLKPPFATYLRPTSSNYRTFPFISSHI